MKIFLKILLLLLFIASLGAFTGLAEDSANPVQDASVLAAIKTLKDNKPFKDPEYSFILNKNSPQGKAFWDLYNTQLDAISVLAKAKVLGTAGLLIPYLGYRPPQYPAMYATDVLHENTTNTFNSWPTLYALTVIPGSTEVLSAYVLNKKNPIDLRFTAFQALTYLDKTEVRNVGEILSKEFVQYVGAIQTIENRTEPFMGMIHMK